MREINRVIASAIIFSNEGKVLMGRKNPNKGGVYIDFWHIPGGGMHGDEPILDTLIREVKEEVGIDISDADIKQMPEKGYGKSERTLENGERVIANMEFNRFEVRLDKNADEIKLTLGDELTEAKWFSPTELRDVEQIPGGKEFFEGMGYIK
jgi:8-oxo-dGTP pyrophosphatase MutT (NUDIX family)